MPGGLVESLPREPPRATVMRPRGNPSGEAAVITCEITLQGDGGGEVKAPLFVGVMPPSLSTGQRVAYGAWNSPSPYLGRTPFGLFYIAREANVIDVPRGPRRRVVTSSTAYFFETGAALPAQGTELPGGPSARWGQYFLALHDFESGFRVYQSNVGFRYVLTVPVEKIGPRGQPERNPHHRYYRGSPVTWRLVPDDDASVDHSW
jgi:hypothetical protein